MGRLASNAIVPAIGLLALIGAGSPSFSTELPIPSPEHPAPAKKKRAIPPASQTPAATSTSAGNTQVSSAQTVNWTGPQAGGFSGFSNMASNFAEPGSNQFFRPMNIEGEPLLSPTSDPETPFGFGARNTRFTAGGFLGYNWQVGNYVVGGEGDAAWKFGGANSALTTAGTAIYQNNDVVVTPATPAVTTTTISPTLIAGQNCTLLASTNYSCTTTTPGTPASITPVNFQPTATRSEAFAGRIAQGWDTSARLRAGYLVTPSLLIYGTGGLAVGQVTGAYSYTATTVYSQFAAGNITQTTSGSTTWNMVRVGWTAGGGAELDIGGGWKLRAEYRYTSFGDFSTDVPLTRTTSNSAFPNPGSTTAHIDMKANFQTVRFGLGFTF
jgi:opacity protein-like surface antigen